MGPPGRGAQKGLVFRVLPWPRLRWGVPGPSLGHGRVSGVMFLGRVGGLVGPGGDVFGLRAEVWAMVVTLLSTS